MNYYLLRSLILQLQNKIEGSVVSRIISPEKNIFYLIFEKGTARNCLEYHSQTKATYIYLKENFSVPGKNISSLIDEAEGSTISAVSLIYNDKLVELNLSGELRLIISFVNLKENILLLRNDIIIGSAKNQKDIVGKLLTEYIPEMKRKEVTGNLTLKDFLRAQSPKLANEVFQTISAQTGIKADQVLDDNLQNQADEKLKEFEKNISSPEFGLYLKDEVLIPSIFQLDESLFEKLKNFKDANSLAASYSHELYRRNILKEVKEKKENELLKKIKLIEKSIRSIEAQISDSETSIRYKLAGDMILANIGSIAAGSKEFIYTDENNTGQKITLKEELSPAENAQFYYQKYKKQKASSGILKPKLEKLNSEKLRTEEGLEELHSITEIKKLKKMEKSNKREENDETTRFRKFVINEGAEVWVGKDSASNDLLTTRYSAQNDLWFHVRGSSGSHTVLKMTDKNSAPPSEFIKTAASIAAYYSKARNAGNVPVAYTERKYVKKKKGFKEGSVVMEREKVVMVKPKLPDM